jgi:ferric-dicitrate binding protein FerR (iron transport regulator)
MHRGYEASHGGLVLFQIPSRRQRIARRRWTALGAVAAMAAAGWLLGALTTGHQEAGPNGPSASSYYPQ